MPRFGEPERATGRWLALLRLGNVVGSTAVAAGALAATGAAGGPWDVLRNTAGLVGVGLLVIAVRGARDAVAG